MIPLQPLDPQNNLALPPMSLTEKIIFSTAIFMYFSFYGFLGLQNALGIHSSLYSAAYRLIPLGLSGILLLLTVMRKQNPRMDICMKSFMLYFLLMVIMLIIYQAPEFYTGTYGSSYGKIFYYYEFTAYSILPMTLFYLTPSRFEFLSRNTWLIFIPTFLSLSIILYYFGDILSGEYGGMDFQGVNRATTKEPMGFMFVMSLYWIVFSGKFSKFAIGMVGLAISLYSLKISSSQSLLLSAAAVCFVTFLLSFKNKSSLAITIVLGVIGASIALPYIMMSKGFQRLQNLMYLSDIYTYGGSYDVSRIDLIKQGLAMFAQSPIFGGNILTPMGGYCHFLFVDVLMAGGIIGFILMCIILYGCLKGALSISRLPTRYYWIVMISTYVFVQLLFHGKATALISMPVMLLLCANSFFGNVRNRA